MFLLYSNWDSYRQLGGILVLFAEWHFSTELSLLCAQLVATNVFFYLSIYLFIFKLNFFREINGWRSDLLLQQHLQTLLTYSLASNVNNAWAVKYVKHQGILTFKRMPKTRPKDQQIDLRWWPYSSCSHLWTSRLLNIAWAVLGMKQFF